MKVEIITTMFNEEFLAPFFLKHYEWADKITALFGEDSNDKTESILRANAKVNIVPLTMPEGIDDALKARVISDIYWASDADWIVIVDADEFAFAGKDDLGKIDQDYSIARVSLPHVYRHFSEADLNLALSIREQRKHGYLARGYVKPVFARGGQDIFWSPGQHGLVGSYKLYPGIFEGVHWANADPCFCIDRRIRGRRDRISQANRKALMGHLNYDISEQSILAECKAHENDPEVWPRPKISFGVMVNDPLRLDMVLRKSEIQGEMHVVTNPESAAKGLNKLLGQMELEDADVGVLTHQDMFYRQGWISQVRKQIALLPESWIIAGIIGKDLEGHICGKFHDRRIPLQFETSDLHQFPHPASCFDECCLIVNLRKRFRFDEGLQGFDLYGTMCVHQALEMGGTAWVIDAYAEHYCMRPFSWMPDEAFCKNFKWLFDRFPNAKLDSTVMAVENAKAEIPRSFISNFKEA